MGYKGRSEQHPPTRVVNWVPGDKKQKSLGYAPVQQLLQVEFLPRVSLLYLGLETKGLVHKVGPRLSQSSKVEVIHKEILVRALTICALAKVECIC